MLGPVLADVAAKTRTSPRRGGRRLHAGPHAAAFGSGATRPFATHLALSTTSWISCPVPAKKTDVLHSIAAVPGLTTTPTSMIDNQETGAKSLEWFQGVLASGGAQDDATRT